MDVDAALTAYAELLRASPHNLMSARGLEELESRHFPESLALASTLPAGDTEGLRLLDIGSGGGLPGLVISLARPDLRVHLLESRGKKTAFLEQAATELGLQVTVHRGRAEELAATQLGGTFDLVTARAVAPLDRLVHWSLPFLVPGGLLYAVKGERWEEELDQAAGALQRSGGSVVATPVEDEHPEGALRLVIVRRDPR